MTTFITLCMPSYPETEAKGRVLLLHPTPLPQDATVITTTHIRRRTLIGVTGLVAVALGMTAYSTSAGATASTVTTTTGLASCATGRPYAASSPWNTPIGSSPTIDARTPAYQKALTAT
ncbi:hypothetical protein, partial [Terrabacter tumescens]|uniref:hypothetical protein n=1 Tax=Terrabacter tumescens TaxID=60443 RepID=UPI001E4A9FE2